MKKTKIKQEQERVIYLLLSTEKKKFLIGHCLKESLRETYRHNLKERRETSKTFIEEIHPERPCLFILETISCKESQATNLLIVWIKILLEKGYESYNRTSLLEMSDHLYFDNKVLYENRKHTEIEKLLSCSNCVIPIYKNKTCESYLKNNTVEGDPKRE